MEKYGKIKLLNRQGNKMKESMKNEIANLLTEKGADIVRLVDISNLEEGIRQGWNNF